MKKHLCFLVFTLSYFVSFSQLLPPIGLSAMPANSAPLCAEPFYLGSFYTSGYQQGDTVPDFKLYNLSGDSIILSQQLSAGKPVLLIAGSLTCPVFRAKVTTINQVMATYSANIKVFVIYTIEAHPTDTSVYFGYVNVTSQNITAGILFPQPQTYGQRKQMLDTMSSFVNLNAPVFIDGPCNNWWHNFGPAPNNSYLIGTNGVVLNKQAWFDKDPDDIFCQLDSILNVNSGLCIPPPAIPGNFTVTALSTSVNCNPQQLLYNYFDVINTSSVVTTVKIKKTQKVLPAAWQTAFCADVCYGTADDSIQVSLNPFDTLHCSFDFFTDAIADSGRVKVGFKNINKPNNSFSLWFKANTLPLDVGIMDHAMATPPFNVYPNPATNKILISTAEKNYTIKVYDAIGKEKESMLHNNYIDTQLWPNGVYLIVFNSPAATFSKRIIISR